MIILRLHTFSAVVKLSAVLVEIFDKRFYVTEPGIVKYDES